MSDDVAHIASIAFHNGGQAFLGAMGDAPNFDRVREAIAGYAANGNAAVVNSTIETLFPNSDSLTDTQVAELGDALVDGWQP